MIPMSEEQTNTSNETPDQTQSGSQSVPMVLITLPQRAALIEFMAKQPYSDVANGIEFLRNAPQVDVNINAPETADIGEKNSD